MTKKTKEKWIKQTVIQHKFWLAAAREEYGQDMLLWPSWMRRYYRSIVIISDPNEAPKQQPLPYGNTGVSEGVNLKK